MISFCGHGQKPYDCMIMGCENHFTKQQLTEPKMSKTGIQIIADERARQPGLGWTEEHDKEHGKDQALVFAAVCYAAPDNANIRVCKSTVGSETYVSPWPWGKDDPQNAYCWSKEDRIRKLAKAGALIAAEIDRIIAEAPNNANELVIQWYYLCHDLGIAGMSAKRAVVELERTPEKNYKALREACLYAGSLSPSLLTSVLQGIAGIKVEILPPYLNKKINGYLVQKRIRGESLWVVVERKSIYGLLSAWAKLCEKKGAIGVSTEAAAQEACSSNDYPEILEVARLPRFEGMKNKLADKLADVLNENRDVVVPSPCGTLRPMRFKSPDGLIWIAEFV